MVATLAEAAPLDLVDVFRRSEDVLPFAQGAVAIGAAAAILYMVLVLKQGRKGLDQLPQ